MIVRHPEILLTKTKIELNKEFQKTFFKEDHHKKSTCLRQRQGSHKLGSIQ